MLGRRNRPSQDSSRASRRYVSAAEAATALSVSEATIRRWAAAGVIASRRWGRTLRIPVEALEAAPQ